MRKLSFVASTLLSLTTLSAMGAEEPKFDCTVAETKMFVEQVTYNVFSPSPVTTPTEFNKAYIEAQAEKGDSACLAIFTDGSLEDGWKDIVDSVREMEIDLWFSSIDAAMLEQLLDQAKQRVQDEVMAGLEQLQADVCQFMSPENLNGMLLDQINKEFGLNVKSLAAQSFADELSDEVLLAADEDIVRLLSEGELADELGGETRNEMRQIRKKLWEGL